MGFFRPLIERVFSAMCAVGVSDACSAGQAGDARKFCAAEFAVEVHREEKFLGRQRGLSVRRGICICRPADTSRRFLSASLLRVAQRKSGEHQESLNQLGGRIRELREEFGISQAELCRRLQRAGWDCDTLVMSRIERGVRTLTDIEILAILRVLNKSLKDF